MQAADSLTSERILEAARDVFAAAPYQRTRSLLDRIRLPRIELDPQTTMLVIAFVFATMVAIVIARLLVRHDGFAMARAGGVPMARPGRDPWAAVADLIASSRWEAAAHALYAAVIASLGREGALDPHPAKTPGDYAREIRSAAPARHPAFLRFVDRWERAVYGTGPVGAETVDSLRADAAAISGR